MKLKSLLTTFLSLALVSCNNDITDIGSVIQPTTDAIVLKIDSIGYADGLTSENIQIESIYSRQDSLLLGSFVSSEFGRIDASILTQLQPPVFASASAKGFPEGATADSIHVILRYFSWFGDKFSPLEVNVYSMDIKTLSNNKTYLSNTSVSEYSTATKLLGRTVLTPRYYGFSKDSTSVVVKLSEEYLNQFKEELTPANKVYNNATLAAFHNRHKGLYINTKFGTSNILNVQRIYVRLFYSYARATGDTVNTFQDYPANEEVRKVNPLILHNQQAVFNAFATKDSLNIIASPANIYTRVSVPYNKIKELKSRVGNKHLLLNRATLRVYADISSTETISIPTQQQVILILEDSVGNYFRNRRIPSDKISALGRITREVTRNGAVNYFYEFDMNKLLSSRLHDANQAINPLVFRLIPIATTTDQSGNITSFAEQNQPRAIKLYSAQHPTKPMRLRIVYSGF